jgi:hypothetical protein
MVGLGISVCQELAKDVLGHEGIRIDMVNMLSLTSE